MDKPEGELTFKEIIKGYSYLAPVLVLVVVFVLVPVLGTIKSSFYQDVTFLPRQFAGLENFTLLFSDPAFVQALVFTLLFVLVSVPIELLLGMGIALLLHHPSPIRGGLRALVLLPWAIPAAVSGRIFELIYNFHFGLANYLMEKAGASAVNWLGTEAAAFWSVVVADVWKTTPFVAIILLAGLSAIPEDLYRQAAVDRAGPVRRFLAITLPLLKPVLLVAVLFRTIDGLRVFDPVFVITGGGPGGSTASLSLFGYRYFSGGDFGYGSAASVLLFLISFGLSLLAIGISRFSRELA